VAYTLLTLAVAAPGTAVGVVLAARRPHNPIGWLLLALLVLTAEAGHHVHIDASGAPAVQPGPV